jgi:3-oxoadipate enol-lactonase
VYLATGGRDFRPSPDQVAELDEQVRREPAALHEVMYQSWAIVAWRDPARLTRLSVPTTIVQGGDDPVVRPMNGQRLAALIPHARYIELPRVGHMVPGEAPEALLHALEPPQAR